MHALGVSSHLNSQPRSLALISTRPLVQPAAFVLHFLLGCPTAKEAMHHSAGWVSDIQLMPIPRQAINVLRPVGQEGWNIYILAQLPALSGENGGSPGKEKFSLEGEGMLWFVVWRRGRTPWKHAGSKVYTITEHEIESAMAIWSMSCYSPVNRQVSFRGSRHDLRIRSLAEYQLDC